MLHPHQLLIVLLCFVHAVSAHENPNWIALNEDKSILLSWGITEETITFKIQARTLGYVGFGISPTGGMEGSDIFVGGVFPNGSVYQSDRYAEGRYTPKLDEQQDWNLLDARENETTTFLTVSRLLNTCDEMDYPIGGDTVRIIWAMGNNDELSYHTLSSRGTKSLNLFAKEPPPIKETIIPFKITTEMVMPSNDTTYWCSFHQGPELDEMHHIVAFEAYLPTQASATYTHHFILHHCYGDDLDGVLSNFTFEQYPGDHCYSPVDYRLFFNLKQHCFKYLYAWAKGGVKMTLPSNVGYPIGDNGQSFFMLEIHYDNPELKQGLTVETGVKFYYTNQTRPNSAGLLIIGHEVNPTMIVPPQTDNFTISGHCGSFCTQTFPHEIKIFNVLLHSHLSGRKLKLRQFRDGQELPFIDYDDHFDFNFQQNKEIDEIEVIPGDHITYECTYSTVWKNGEIVIGGISTRDEMCQSFVWYYPRIDIGACMSASYLYWRESLSQSMAEFGITKYSERATSPFGFPPLYIDEPPELRGEFQDSLSTKFNWTDFNTEFQHKRRYGVHVGYCRSYREYSESYYRVLPTVNVTYPAVKRVYQPKNVCSARKKIENNYFAWFLKLLGL